MKLIIDRIKLAERSFASGRMRYIRILCYVKLDDQSQIPTIEPILVLLWREGGIFSNWDP